MALEPGTHLGTFEIIGQLGAGGMGEVYRAIDTKLGREVAIKTLPSAIAADKERLARFEREAKLLAALNHAHIASVYSLDEHDGVLYLAMELVEGETLEERLKAGALPVDEAIRIAVQIAEALEAAHDKGVVHRDLKPANIMLTADDQVKVLDFGLAKAFSGNPIEASPLHSPALSVAMTQAGLVLGTAGYMSPEQASGQATDQRSDIWAFGVVLYEMLSGLPLFKGESVPHILADVLKTEPDWQRLPKNLHPRLKMVLERCLTKKPRNRWHAIADVRVEIEGVLADPAGPTPERAAAAVGGRPAGRWRLAAAIAVTAVIAVVVGWFGRPIPEAEPGPVIRFTAPYAEGQEFSAAPVSMITESRDGTKYAYIANGQIFLRELSDPEARPVLGTDQDGLTAAVPAFSPDGQWLAYVHVMSATGPFVIERVPISGGAPVQIYKPEAVTDFPFGLSWPEPDTILFTGPDGIVRIPANGGATEVLVPRGEGERFFSPQLLPGDDAVLFTRLTGEPGTPADFAQAQIAVQSIGADDRTVVWEGGSAARYLPSGHLVYAQGAALFAIAFDPQTRMTHGGPVPMLQRLRRSSNANSDAANFAVSDTGTLVMIPGSTENPVAGARIETTLTWVDRDGREEPLGVRPDDYTWARISPDGTKVALVVGGVQIIRDTLPSIWIYDLDTENLSLLTGDPAGDDGPVWSSDSSRIYFRSLRDDQVGIYAIDIATGETTLVASPDPDVPIPLAWSVSPDGETLAIVSALSTNETQLATLSVSDGTYAALPLEQETNEQQPVFSPDGAWIAYQQLIPERGVEIDIRPFPNLLRTRIPVGTGEAPLFSADGTELFYFDHQGIASAPITYEPTLRVGTPKRLFASGAYMWNALGRAWDADPSGQRFLVIRQPGASDTGAAPPRPQVDVVVNWVEELKARVPVD